MTTFFSRAFRAHIYVGQDNSILYASERIDVHAGEEQGAAQYCAGYDASSGNKGGQSMSAAALLIVNKFGRRV